MIRQANNDDIMELLRMGKAFCEASHTPFHAGTLIEFCQQTIPAWDRVILVEEVDARKLCGMLVGYLHPLYTDKSSYSATELAWWVDPEYRGKSTAIRLLKEFETWARAAGAHYISVASEAALDGERVGKIYERAGFALRELTYIKKI